MRQQTQPPVSGSRDEFCEYLRSRRDKAEMSLAEIAKVTRIPIHSLERLEDGRFEDLPADVFVRGFLRSYAKCVGVDADAAIRAYARCGLAPAPVSSEMADEVLRTMPKGDSALASGDTVRTIAGGARSEPAPAKEQTQESAKESAQEPVESREEDKASDSDKSAQQTRRSRQSKNSRSRSRSARRRRRSRGRASSASRPAVSRKPQPRREVEAAPAPTAEPDRVAEPSPEVAVRPKRQRTFLPPSFGEEESGRRGPLTLAVIILVIIATLTMSYLLRRPGSSADGYTAVPEQSDDLRA